MCPYGRIIVVTPALKVRAGIHAMARSILRVAAFAAVGALFLQFFCAMGFAPVTHLEAAAPVGSGCHESVPATPSMPDQGHVCCDGNYSSDALLTAAYITAMPMVSQILHIPAFGLATPDRLFAATVGPSSGPPVPFALRI